MSDHPLRRASDRRALDERPAARRVAAVLWSAFLGASCSMVVLLLAPETWALQDLDPGRAALAFIVLFALAVVPALSAMLLSTPADRDHGR